MPLIRKPSDQTPPSAPGKPEEDFRSALMNGTNEQRWAAARALADMPGAIEALGRALLTESDPRVRQAIFTSFARLQTPESVQALIPHLRSDDSNVRTGALDALRIMAGAAAGYLPELFRDADSDVRLLACEIARGLPGGDATRLLCELLETEEDVNVCAGAIDVLAEVGRSEALPVLARCAQRFSNEPFLGYAIKVALDRIGLQTRDPRG